ncbi:MAG: SGNH/GDSL hydrolase family protein [Microcystaceae cyanobacterium]
MKTIIALFLGALLGLVILIEGGLRLIFGFGKRPIFLADPEIGYLFAPNQKVKRFGKTILINQYSLRSDPIKLERDQDTLRVLMIGDSIINGNWWTDQKAILSELVKQRLDVSQFANIEVLNASANSWGPRNQLAYVKRFGTFDSQMILLVINPDDFFARQPNSLVVGKDKNYPDHQPSSAIGEVIEEVFSRSSPIKRPKEPGGDRMKLNLNAMTEMKAIAEENNSQFMVAVTPLLRELDKNESKEQDKRGRMRLQKWATEQQVHLIDVLPQFTSVEDPKTLYRDHIHLSPLGDQIVAEILATAIDKSFNEVGVKE